MKYLVKFAVRCLRNPSNEVINFLRVNSLLGVRWGFFDNIF